MPFISFSQQKVDGNYKVVDIKSSKIKKNKSKDFNLIFITDSIGTPHLIISPKAKDTHRGEMIKAGKTYHFSLNPYFENHFIPMSPDEPLRICIQEKCLVVRIDVKKWIEIYTTDQLAGLSKVQ